MQCGCRAGVDEDTREAREALRGQKEPDARSSPEPQWARQKKKSIYNLEALTSASVTLTQSHKHVLIRIMKVNFLSYVLHALFLSSWALPCVTLPLINLKVILLEILITNVAGEL